MLFRSKDEDAIKDAVLTVQKQKYEIINEAQAKADQIIADAQAKADELEDEAVHQHAIAMEKNRAEIAKEQESLIEARRQVSDFKKSLFDMYKTHLEMISTMPECDEEEETAEEIANAIAGEND